MIDLEAKRQAFTEHAQHWHISNGWLAWTKHQMRPCSVRHWWRENWRPCIPFRKPVQLPACLYDCSKDQCAYFWFCSLSWVSMHHTLHAVTGPGVGDEVTLVSDKVMLDDDARSATPAVWAPAACSVRPLTPTPTKPHSPLSSMALEGWMT